MVEPWQAETPVFFASRLDMPKHIDQARAGGFKLVIIDTPPQATSLISAVVALADLVLIPTRPSPDDLDAVGRMIDIVENAGADDLRDQRRDQERPHHQPGCHCAVAKRDRRQVHAP
jgi:cellulose biosynthesis protein BcsQ